MEILGKADVRLMRTDRKRKPSESILVEHRGRMHSVTAWEEEGELNFLIFQKPEGDEEMQNPIHIQVDPEEVDSLKDPEERSLAVEIFKQISADAKPPK